jgi:hypothetical protein
MGVKTLNSDSSPSDSTAGLSTIKANRCISAALLIRCVSADKSLRVYQVFKSMDPAVSLNSTDFVVNFWID